MGNCHDVQPIGHGKRVAEWCVKITKIVTTPEHDVWSVFPLGHILWYIFERGSCPSQVFVSLFPA